MKTETSALIFKNIFLLKKEKASSKDLEIWKGTLSWSKDKGVLCNQNIQGKVLW